MMLGHLKVDAFKITNTKTRSSLEVISSDAPSSFGLLLDFAVCDEVTIWPKRDMFDSIFSSAGKRKNCMLLCIGNAGFRDSWVWELRESVRQNDQWYFSALDGPQADWITPDRLAEQEAILPGNAYRRLWLNEWSDAGGDALTAKQINRAFDSNLKPHTHALPGFEYVAGVDLGVTRDASAVCILAVKREWAGHGTIRLAATRIWRPTKSKKVDLQSVENELLLLHDRFKFRQLNYDPWEMRHLASRLQAGGLGRLSNVKNRKVSMPMVEITPSGKNLQAIASAVIETFSDGRISLFDDSDLRRDLHRLRIEERSFGFRLVSPRDQFGHGDMGTAFGLALLAATQFAEKRRIQVGVVSNDNDGTPFQRDWAAFERRQESFAHEQEIMRRPANDSQEPIREVFKLLGR